MQVGTPTTSAVDKRPVGQVNDRQTPPSQWANYSLIRRNGAVVGFEPSKIGIALTKAFLAVNGGQGAASARVRELVEQLTNQVVGALLRGRPNGGTFHIEDVQDAVELALMRSGEHDVARAYVLYRERRSQERAQSKAPAAPASESTITIKENGLSKPLDLAKLKATIAAAGVGLEEFVDNDLILKETLKNLYDGVPIEEVYKSAILAARVQVEKDPAYSKATARLLMHSIRTEVLGREVSQDEMLTEYATYFPKFIKKGLKAVCWHPSWVALI